MFRRVRFSRSVESSASNRAASPHPVPTMDPTVPSAGPHPVHTPASAIRVARIGGTIADVAAAAFSAHTLYHLGGQLDLGPWTAWLLPAALDVFAFTALATGYSLPVDHPGQKHVLRTARLALAMTVGATSSTTSCRRPANWSTRQSVTCCWWSWPPCRRWWSSAC